MQYQFQKNGGFNLKISDKCCYRLKKEIAHKYEKESGKYIAITGIRASEGGMRNQGGCTIFDGNKLHKFHPIKVVSDEWEELFIKNNNIELCKLYYPPYNFERTGCRFCPFALNIAEELERAFIFLPKDYKAGVNLWKPVYDEYIRIGYRLKYYPHEKPLQLDLDYYLNEGVIKWNN